MITRPYSPGGKGKRNPAPLSEYGKELREKQKLKNWYNLREAQFRKYVKTALTSRKGAEDAAAFLIKNLESRLDNVIFRLGIASSRLQARQLVSHGHFLINGKSVNIPSYHLKKNDIITIKPSRLKKNFFQNLSIRTEKQKIPSWLSFDVKKLEGKIIDTPKIEEVMPPVEISSIFEFYSR